MKRCEIWWADLPQPAGKRPVVLLSRNEAYAVRELVTVAPLTTRVREIPVEVELDKSDGVPKNCVINFDMITTVPKKCLKEKITTLSKNKIAEVDSAITFALGIDD